MTKAEYILSLEKMKPTAYMFGTKIENILENKRLRAGIEATAATYELAETPEYRDLIVTRSPLIDEPINRFNNPPASVSDLVARVKINRLLGQRVGTCFQRCTGQDCLVALSITTYDADRKYGTEYHKRFVEFLKHMQKNDLTANAGVTDVKGDRNLSPQDQPDKDAYLHVVEKRGDGIVVRGAKCHQTGLIIGSRNHRPADPGPAQGRGGICGRLCRAERHAGRDSRRRPVEPGYAGTGRL